MIRRQIFFGVTLVLLAILLFLILRGRNVEKEHEAQNIKFIEEVASERPSPVRALQPRDLKIVDAKTAWTRNPDEKDASAARHDIIIRNIGEGSYVNLRLRMEYLDGKGKTVEVRTHIAEESLNPGGTLRISDIVIDGLPDAAADFRAAILSADLGSGAYQN